MDQKQYWNSNLRPDNLERELANAGAAALEKELKFSDSPDQVAGRAWLGEGGGRVCVEIGSGLGANAVRLSEKFPVVIATDLALERLRKMRGSLPDAARARVFPVACKAEHLPFRDEVIDGAFSRSVLIHTDVAAAAAECRRVLRMQGRIAFIEPLRHNPLVNAYRNSLAPAVWKKITSYFDREEISAVAAAFPDVKENRFYLLGFAAFAWQYAVPCRTMFEVSLRTFSWMDSVIFHLFPKSRKYAWFTLLMGTKTAEKVNVGSNRVSDRGTDER